MAEVYLEIIDRREANNEKMKCKHRAGYKMDKQMDTWEAWQRVLPIYPEVELSFKRGKRLNNK